MSALFTDLPCSVGKSCATAAAQLSSQVAIPLSVARPSGPVTQKWDNRGSDTARKFERNGDELRLQGQETSSDATVTVACREDISICRTSENKKCRLGEGGFGVVYKALMNGVDEVAIKLVKADKPSPKELTLFHKEVSACPAATPMHVLTLRSTVASVLCVSPGVRPVSDCMTERLLDLAGQSSQHPQVAEDLLQCVSSHNNPCHMPWQRL